MAHATDQWNGRDQSYRSSPDWQSRIESVELHEQTSDVDPITYEVIRHRLWTINMAHGETVLRASGSPVLAALDFNMTIMTETGEFVMSAPFSTFLVGGSSLAIRFVLERLSRAPGIEPGDVFVVNDPWIGANHQMDVLFLHPVFLDGALFAWVANAGHHYDLGGIVPGGWPQNAPDVYSDPFCFPPFKLVEKGTLRNDLEEIILRQSRMRDLVALDLRAQLAGNKFAHDELVALCARYGPDVVKGAMRKVIADAQAAFSKQLSAMPDGRWSDVRYIDEALPGDRKTYRTQLNVTKQGDRLVIDNDGTDEQVEGVVGIVYSTFQGSIMGALAVTMLYDELFAVGGAERQIDFRPTPGRLTCVNHPAEVSGGVMNCETHHHAIHTIISGMQGTVDELRKDIYAPGGDFPLAVLTGEKDSGAYYGQALLEAYAPGTGAGPGHDGVDTGGKESAPLAKVVNVEMIEQWYPVLYLYRREAIDGGGVGSRRGGTGLESAITPYRARTMTAVTNTGGQGVSTAGGAGLCGGFPAPPSRYTVRKDTNLLAWFADRRLPDSVDDLEAGTTIRLAGKSNPIELGEGDVLELRVAGAGGYGDPIARSPELVANDVRLGYVSAAVAKALYGVALAGDGEADLAASERLRAEILNDRAKWSRCDAGKGPGDLPSTPATGEPVRRLQEYIEAKDERDLRVLACAQCGEVLGDYASNYKHGLLIDEGPLSVLPTAPDPSAFIDAQMVLRRYCCPGCKVLIKTEVARAGEPVVDDMRLGSAIADGMESGLALALSHE